MTSREFPTPAHVYKRIRALGVVRYVYFFLAAAGAMISYSAAVWYYWRSVLAFPLVLLTPWSVAAIVRMGNIIYGKTEPKRSHYVEAAGSIGVSVLVLWHLYRVFGFPEIISSNIQWRTLAVFFVVVSVAMLLLMGAMIPFLLAWFSLTDLFEELQGFREAVRRIINAFYLFVLLDTAFAAGYQWIAFLYPNSFDLPLSSFADAFYFSTQTITILGGQDLSPVSSAAKLLVSLETVLGLLFVGAVLTFIVAMPSGKGKEPGSDL